jgi:hypothetical protein
MQQIVEGGMTTKRSRMGGLGKLSDFGKTSKLQPEKESEPTESTERVTEPELLATPTDGQQQPTTEKLVTINIKITRTQQSWLTETARKVRDNNDTPVAPSERVFPQHLIGVAIDLLRQSDIDWSTVRNLEDLRQQLRL